MSVEVVHPGLFRTFGLPCDGGGIVRAVRRRPWLAPLVFLSMVRALRRVARGADLVHAHWLAGGLVAAFAGKPFVVTLHGSISGGLLDDFRLCERHPRVVRFLLRNARAVICVSESLAAAARAAGVERVEFVPNGIAVPRRVGAEAEPLEIFYTGRLSEEKGIAQLAEACRDLNLVVCGDGPLRDLVPQTRGFVARADLNRHFARAAVVVCPSLSEGFGVVCAEAMAHGKPVVASATGGLANLVRHEETGLLVPPGDVTALRAAIERLLADDVLRRRLGAAARRRITRHYGWERVIEETICVYEQALRPRAPMQPDAPGRALAA
jgi:2-deoxystreptamine N-acetyl-D-glucosaminyltransferase/2-deoxystreptamine glucosyltransferase